MNTQVQQIKAEIERLIRENIKTDTYKDAQLITYGEEVDILNKLLSFINSLPEEPVSEDLEEAAQTYTEKGSQCQEEMDAFIAGANWRKEQMIKDAIVLYDELAMCYIDDKPIGLSGYIDWWDTKEVEEKFKDGDKVKLIIIKEDK